MQHIGTMKKTLITLKKRLFSPITILGWTASSLLLAIMGPFNTYEAQPVTGRLLFWSGILFLGTALGIFFQLYVRKRFTSWGIVKTSVVACSLFVLVQWALVIQIVHIVYAHLGPPPYLLILLIILGAGTSIYSIVYLVSPETLLGDEFTKPNLSTRPARPSQQAVQTPDTDKNTNPFLEQLGPNSGEHLIRLAMRDHYIEVYTEVGQKLVHMRLGDAVSKLEDLNGGLVHRSHWINFDAIQDVVKDGDKLNFRMSDGALVPIARSRKPDLKKRGLI